MGIRNKVLKQIAVNIYFYIISKKLIEYDFFSLNKI